jgi:acyl carrier protein
MNRQQIEEVVISVLSTVLKREICNDDSRENLVQWDSLKHIEVIFAIEDELNVEFPEKLLPDLNSVVSIVDAVEGLYEA